MAPGRPAGGAGDRYMTTLQHIKDALAAHQPQVLPDAGRQRAAVALVLCKDPGSGAPGSEDPGSEDPGSEALGFEASDDRALRLLFIERTEHQGDPWSGHLAFPGGRVEEQDRSVRDTAERETLEEIGLDLRGAEYLGRLDDLTGATIPMVVSGFVYVTPSPAVFELNHEVSKVFWFSLDDLLDAKRHSHYRLRYEGVERTVHAIDLLGPGRPLLWGLTYRFVTQFLKLLGHEGPDCLS